MKRKGAYLFFMIVTLVFLILYGCSTEEQPVIDETAPADVPEATDAAGEQTTEPEMTTLRVGGVGGPTCLNPFACSGHWPFNYLAYEGFTGSGPECKTYPRLAKSWEVSDDGLTWTLHLQEGARFTDGTPFTAQSAVDWIEWFNSTSLTNWYYTAWNMSSIEALDDFTLQFTTDVPIGNFPTYDGPWWWVLPAQDWGDLDEDTLWDFEAPPNGTGPYDITEWVADEYIIYDAKPDYYLGKPAIDRIVYQQFSNWDAVVQALSTGEIDMTRSWIPAQYFEVLDNDPNVIVEERPPGTIRTLYFNMAEGSSRHPAIGDPALREAIDYAIDREKARDIALEGHGMLCPNNYACGQNYEGDINPELTVTPFDINRAGQILADAGYQDSDNDGVLESPDGQALRFRVFVDEAQPPDLVIAEQIQETLGQIGIALEIEVLESGTLAQALLTDRDYDLAVFRYWPDLDPAAFDFYLSCWSADAGSGALNRSGWCNAEVDDLTYAYFTTPDRSEAMSYIYEAQAILNQERPMLSIVGDFMIEGLRTDKFDFPIPGNSCDMNPGHWNWPLILEARPK